MKRLRLVFGLLGLGVCLPRPADAETEVSRFLHVDSFFFSSSFHNNRNFHWQTIVGLEVAALALESDTFEEIGLFGSGRAQTVATILSSENRWLRLTTWLFQPEFHLRWRDWPIEIAAGFNHFSSHQPDVFQGRIPQFNNPYTEIRLRGQLADPRSRPNQVWLRGQYNILDDVINYQRPVMAGFYWEHALIKTDSSYLSLYNEQFIEAGNVLFYAGELGFRIVTRWNTPFEFFTLWTNGQQGVSALWGAAPNLHSRSSSLFDVGARLRVIF